MERRQVNGFVLGVAVLLGIVWSRDAGASVTRADSLYWASVAQVGAASSSERIKRFEDVLNADRGYAPAHYELAKLYLSLNTPEDRQRAERAIREAIRLAPDDVDYQLLLGDVMWAQGFRHNAAQHYERVLQNHPEGTRAAYWIGLRAFKEFMKYIEMINPETTKGPGGSTTMIVHMTEFGERERDKAVEHLTKSVEVDPSFADAYYPLGLIYFEDKQPKGLIRVAERLLKHDPDSKDALMFCGLGYQALGNYRKAYDLYVRALAQMHPDERGVMESIAYIASEGVQREIGGVAGGEDGMDSASVWRDALGIERFWRRQDPLYLTPYNERRIDHYGRVAYANLSFSRPSEGIEGWRTDKGMAYIRFGRYLRRTVIRPSIDKEDLDQEVTVRPHTEAWMYEGFRVMFRNWDGLDHWAFDPKTSRNYVRSLPPRHVDPFGRQKYTMPHLVVAFQEEDAVRLEVSYAIPETRVKRSEPEGFIYVDEGVFLFDENWDEVCRKQDTTYELEEAGADRVRRCYLLSHRSLTIDPGQYQLAVEVGDKRGGSIGTFQEQRALSFPDTALAVSDLLLASQIAPANPFPESRQDLTVVPNPLRSFTRSEPVFIYLEVYNLARDAFGRTGYDISYRLGRPKQDEVDPALFAALDLPEASAYMEIETAPEGTDTALPYRVRYVLPERNRILPEDGGAGRSGMETETAVTARYEGDREDDFTYLQIDIRHVPAGVHKLTVTARDVHTGQAAERNILFRVIE